jgi:hypothetical protein
MLERKGPGETGWIYTTKAKWLLIESPTHIIRTLFSDFQKWSLSKMVNEWSPTYQGAMGNNWRYKRVVYNTEQNADEMFLVSYAQILSEMKNKISLYPKWMHRDADGKLQLNDNITR